MLILARLEECARVIRHRGLDVPQNLRDALEGARVRLANVERRERWVEAVQSGQLLQEIRR